MSVSPKQTGGGRPNPFNRLCVLDANAHVYADAHSDAQSDADERSHVSKFPRSDKNDNVPQATIFSWTLQFKKYYGFFLLQRYNWYVLMVKPPGAICSPWSIYFYFSDLMAIAGNLVFAHSSLFRELQAPKFWKKWPPKLAHLLTALPQMAANIRIYRSRPKHAKCRL